jgi:RNA polymerase sigma factor (sigma-70 family)
MDSIPSQSPRHLIGISPSVTPDIPSQSDLPMTGGLADLVNSARKGDRSAFEDLVKATYAGSYTLAYRLVGDEEDARDVVQEAYLRAYKGLKRFRGDAQFTTWLYRITANCAATHLGKRARNRHEELLDDAAVILKTAPTSATCGSGSTLPWQSSHHAFGPWWSSATSTTCPTRRSQPSWVSRSRRPRCVCTAPGESSANASTL